MHPSKIFDLLRKQALYYGQEEGEDLPLPRPVHRKQKSDADPYCVVKYDDQGRATYSDPKKTE